MFTLSNGTSPDPLRKGDEVDSTCETLIISIRLFPLFRSQMYEFLGYYSYIFRKIAYICSQVKLIKSNQELI